MKWHRAVLGSGAIGIGFGLLSAIDPQRRWQAAAIAAFAAAGVIAGIDGMLHRRQAVVDATLRYATYHGTAAVWGSVWLITLGMVLLVVAWTWYAGVERQLMVLVLRRPGMALIPAGVSTLCSGVAHWYGWRLTHAPTSPLARTVGNRIGGMLGVTFGAALTAAGLVEIMAPVAFDAILGSMRHALEQWALGAALRP